MHWKTVAALLFIPFLCLAQTRNPDDYTHVPFNLGLVHGISIGDAVAKNSGKPVMHDGFSLNAISGKSARLNGFSLTGVYQEYTEDASGVLMTQVATVGGKARGAMFGALNMVGGGMRGAQFAYIANTVDGKSNAAQFAGIANINGNDYTGAQFSGIVNLNGGDFRGAEFAGIGNIDGGDVTGGQFAGIINATGGDVTGAQFAGIANVTGGDATGIRAAGIVNATGGTTCGLHFAGIANVSSGIKGGLRAAGIVNIAEEAEGGIQIAPVNIFRKNKGIPIGLVSYVEEVGFRYDVWGTETGFIHAGLRSGNEHFYNLVAFGIAPGDSLLWSFGAGFGGRIELSPTIGIEPGLFAQYVKNDGPLDENPNVLATLSVLGTFDLGPVWLTAGPTFNVWASDEEIDPDLVPFNILDEDDDHNILAWPGFQVGLRF